MNNAENFLLLEAKRAAQNKLLLMILAFAGVSVIVLSSSFLYVVKNDIEEKIGAKVEVSEGPTEKEKTLEAEVKELTEANRRKDQELIQKNELIQTLEESASGDDQTLIDRIKDLEDSIAEKDKTIEDLNDRPPSNEEALVNEINEGRKRIRDKDKRITELEDQLRKCESNRSNDTRLTECINARKAAEKERDACMAKLRTAEANYKKISTTNTKCQRDLRACLANRPTDQSAEVKRLENTIVDLRRQLATCERDLKSCQRTRPTDQSAEVKRLEGTNADLRKQLATCKRQLAASSGTKDCKEIEAELNKLRVEYEVVASQNISRGDQIACYEKCLGPAGVKRCACN